jgi:maleylacetate reductase
VARALGVEDAPRGLHVLTARIGAPLALRDLGLKESDLDRVAEIASRDPCANPRAIERVGMRALLQDAWAGVTPRRSPPPG